MKISPDHCFHLDTEIVREIHAAALAEFGGSAGVRDPALLESAIAAPQAAFGGQSVYADVVEIAGAYLYYLCRNHPFLDGNKRAALGACLVFLRLNGLTPAPDREDWKTLTMGVAASVIDREELTGRLRKMVRHC
ncbi:MAG: type II toxin-antitoxin system death-on-curing family toxin [Verrucomicrobiales bacterium]|jgi:death-on-curing protein|nr:type II toxin-antitoxin system death-on-curing family toxin [Verrucomicrobiales bacterium]MDR1305662.1 type II toxin-antitoxin system death-on-curing family toxin [Verrucomicrobiales bacterium]